MEKMLEVLLEDTRSQSHCIPFTIATVMWICTWFSPVKLNSWTHIYLRDVWFWKGSQAALSHLVIKDL